MEFNITARHFDLSPNLKEYIIEKFSKLDKYFRGTAQADVILDVEKHRKIIEISLHGNRTKFVGKEVSDDMYASIDLLVDSVENQIKRNKEKRTDRRTKGVKLSESMLDERLSNAAEPGPGPREVNGHRIIQTKKFAVKPMSVDEAALQLDVLPDDFLVFRNAENERVNVIYKRKDGHYGLIEPEF